MNFEVFLKIESLANRKEVWELGLNPKGLEFRKENGLYVVDERIEKCNSLLTNFNLFLYQFLLSGSVQGVDQTGSAFNIDGGTSTAGTNRLNMVASGAGAGGTNGGILVGTGTTANTISTYAMATLIAHGTTANKLSYGATTSVGYATSGATAYWEINRTFTNSSGGNITVTEVGAAGRTYNLSSTFILFERTVLGASVTINNGSSKTFTYKFTVTV